MGKIHWNVRESESAMSDPVLCVFMRWGMECDRVRVSVEGQQSWYVCELGGVCTLWHCHWSSLASCSALQGTDKDFIQLFLTHKHTTLCLSFARMHKSSFYALEFHGVSLSLCLCVSAVWMIKYSLQLLALIDAGIGLIWIIKFNFAVCELWGCNINLTG